MPVYWEEEPQNEHIKLKNEEEKGENTEKEQGRIPSDRSLQVTDKASQEVRL